MLTKLCRKCIKARFKNNVGRSDIRKHTLKNGKKTRLSIYQSCTNLSSFFFYFFKNVRPGFLFLAILFAVVTHVTNRTEGQIGKEQSGWIATKEVAAAAIMLRPKDRNGSSDFG